VQRVIRFLKRALHIERRLTVDELVHLSEEIVGYGRMASLYLLPDPATQARTVGVDVDDLAFRLRETTRSVTAALILLEKEGRARNTWLDGHWILHLKPQDTRSKASEGHRDQRSA
jgi:hypothetical protein